MSKSLEEQIKMRVKEAEQKNIAEKAYVVARELGTEEHQRQNNYLHETIITSSYVFIDQDEGFSVNESVIERVAISSPEHKITINYKGNSVFVKSDRSIELDMDRYGYGCSPSELVDFRIFHDIRIYTPGSWEEKLNSLYQKVQDKKEEEKQKREQEAAEEKAREQREIEKRKRAEINRNEAILRSRFGL